ncbi:MAG: flippase-like domain-containing protein [Candidatus Aenigmatarchaeota archaeon]
MRRLFKAVMLTLSLGILAAVAMWAKPDLLISIVAQSNPALLAAALCLSSAVTFLRVLKWKVLIKGLGFADAALTQLAGMTVGNFTPGKMGEPVKSLFLKQRTGIPASASLPAIIWERMLDATVMVALAIAGFWAVSLGTVGSVAGLVGVSIFCILLAIAMAVLRCKRAGFAVLGATKRLPLLNRIGDDFVQTFYASKIRSVSIMLSLIFTFAVWVLDGAILWITFAALGVELPILAAVSIFALSVIIGYASTLPGGLGSTEAVLTLMLIQLGVSAAVAVSGVFLARALTFWYGTVFGGIAMLCMAKKA